MYGIGTLKAAAGTWARTMHFAGNGIFLPDIDTSCNVISMAQGFGRDEWFLFYKYAFVGGSKIAVRIKNITGVSSATSTNYQPLNCAVFPWNVTEDGSYTPTNVLTYPPATRPYAISRLLNQPDGGGAQTTMKSYMSTSKMLAQKIDLDDVKNLNTSVADPTALWQWIVAYYPPSGTVALGEISFEVRITYYVTYLNRNSITKS